MLQACGPTAQWVFERIEPMMKGSPVYGYLPVEDDELADLWKLSRTTVVHALHELRIHGLMRKGYSGDWYSPVLIAELVSKCRS